DMVGIARPLAVVPDLPQRLLNGSVTRADIKRRLTGIKVIDDMAMMETAWYTKQLERIAKGEPTKPNEHPLLGFLRYVSVGAVRGFKTQRLRAG
ncbi:MAG TPA: hypothetical protein VM553_12115, partial [Dongiaceae bacterium]|nr:hypothetical protein [Dongiaceae bacterium]